MDYVHFHAQLHCDHLAVTDITHDRHWTYRQFDSLIGACVGVLGESGVGEGDRVACLSMNRAEVIALHHACARLGAIFVPLNWRLSAAEITDLIEDCTPSVLYGDELAAELGIMARDINGLIAECESIKPGEAGQKSPDLPSLMLYTSGTTGRPKGVLLSERNLSEIAINSSLLLEAEATSRFYCESPMFHVIGMVTMVRGPLMVGAQVLVSDRFIPERTFARLADDELGITHYFCVPQMAQSIRACEGFDATKLRRLKGLFTGGAPHPEPQIRDWLSEGVTIVDGYGMTEVGTTFGMPRDHTLIDSKAGCVGIPTPRVQARLVDAEGIPVAPGIPGELELHGDNVTVGYWGRMEEFNAGLSEDGWFRTGDIMTCDEDGYFRVTDRKKDMFISGGENVYPVEVEAALDKFPGVVELAVIGVPDPRWGEVGCLYYVPGEDGGSMDIESLESYLSDSLARYKIPKILRQLEALPRNGVGKLMRHELRRIYASEVN